VHHALHDRAHGTLEPAGRVELDDQRLGALGLGAVDGDAHETQRDRADHALELDRGHRRRRGRRGPGNGQEAGERDEARQPRHFWSARRLTISNIRLAASSAVICPGPSYGGETSTTSAPTMFRPASARTSTSASYDVSPPTSGVPVAGANAGSTASMSHDR